MKCKNLIAYRALFKVPSTGTCLQHPSVASNYILQKFFRSTVADTYYPWLRFAGGTVPHTCHWWHQDYPERNPDLNPGNEFLWTYYTSYVCMTVIIQPQYDGRWGFVISWKLIHNTFKWSPCWFFWLDLTVLWIVHSNQISYLGNHKNSFLDFSISNPRKSFLSDYKIQHHFYPSLFSMVIPNFLENHDFMLSDGIYYIRKKYV